MVGDGCSATKTIDICAAKWLFVHIAKNDDVRVRVRILLPVPPLILYANTVTNVSGHAGDIFIGESESRFSHDVPNDGTVH